jgi:hypothetical protein
MANDEKVKIARPGGARARIFALTALGALTACVGYVGQQGYLAATDSFVAPIILSPDNDQVLATKLHASQLAVERARTASEVDAVDETIAAGQKAIARLKGIQRTPATSLAWTSRVNAHQVSAGYGERQMLAAQHKVLVDMADKQERIVTSGHANLGAGLISETEYTKELQTQNQLRLALLDNERTRLQTDLQMQQAKFTRQSIAGDAPPMPEVMMHEEQMVRVELEIMRLESEQRSKASEKKLLVDKLATLDEVEAQLKTRPIFRAAEKSMDVAFVPYTQINGVRAGATVYDCTWGAFNCKSVGNVAELVPGEVVLPDPWGNQARGQYAILALRRHESAKSKTLRIRGTNAPATPAQPERDDRVSAK